jgi:hypothetical protein
MTKIIPLFFIETLADLEKEVRAGRTPEKVVGNLDRKTPHMQSAANMHHWRLLRWTGISWETLPSIIDVSAGDHVITISKNGYSPWERKLKTRTHYVESVSRPAKFLAA